MADEHPTIEQWLPFPHILFKHTHSISNTGRVRRDVPGRGRAAGSICHGSLSSNGYRIVKLKKSSCQFKVHQFVLIAFGDPKPSPKHEVNHRNGKKDDNRIENLEWVTRQQNYIHARDVLGKFQYPLCGETIHLHKLRATDIPKIRQQHELGRSLNEIATNFNVTKGTIWHIIANRTWKHIPK